MLFALMCQINNDYKEYHRELVKEVYEKFDLSQVYKQELPSHFTIKYPFLSKNSTKVELLVKNFTSNNPATDFTVGGVNGFPAEVVFHNVELSSDAYRTYDTFLKELKKIDIYPWNKFDYPNNRFHSTIAANCEDKYFQVISYLKQKDKIFKCKFDNITILKCPEGQQLTNSWKLHKNYRFNG